MNFSYWFSNRLKLSQNTPASTVTGAVIAVTGVALALMVMELSLAVTSGFKHEIERKIFGFDAPVTVLPAYDYNTATSDTEIHLTDTLSAIITGAIPDAVQVPVFNRHAIIKTDNDFMAVQCKSYGHGHNDNFEQANITAGSWPDFNRPSETDSIVISTVMADKLGIDIGDRIYMYFMIDDSPKARRAFVSGTYKSNFGEYDNSIVYTSIDMMRRLSHDSLSATGIALEGIDKKLIADNSDRLQKALVDAYRNGSISKVYPVTDILDTGAVFFNWLDLLDTNVVVIFILMIAVAAFTLISSLFIIILDRVTTIGVLRSLGASQSVVKHIFIFVTLRLVGFGMLIGNILSIGIIYLQRATHFLSLDPDMYYLDFVPLEFNWVTLLILNIGTAATAWLILILPAKLASRVDPASAMRYE